MRGEALDRGGHVLGGLALAHEHALEIARGARRGGEHVDRAIEGVQRRRFACDRAFASASVYGVPMRIAEALDGVERERGDGLAVDMHLESPGAGRPAMAVIDAARVRRNRGDRRSSDGESACSCRGYRSGDRELDVDTVRRYRRAFHDRNANRSTSLSREVEHEVPKGKGATRTVSGCPRHSTSPFGTTSPTSHLLVVAFGLFHDLRSVFLMPSTTFTFSSISSIMLVLSFRNIFAFSRPCPMRCPL